MKTFVLDTNILIHDHNSIFMFGSDNKLIIPMTVVEELDNLKSKNNEVGYNAVNPTYAGAPMVTSAGEALGSHASVRPQGLGIGDGTQIAELSMTVEKAQVEAKTKKLRSRWSMEVAQDLKAMHNIDAESELIKFTDNLGNNLLNGLPPTMNSSVDTPFLEQLLEEVKQTTEAECFPKQGYCIIAAKIT